MKILFMSDRYPPYFDGGYEIICQDVADALVDMGHDVHILTSDHGVGRPCTDGKVYRLLYSLSRLEDEGVQRRLGQLGNACQGYRNYWITRRVVKSLKPDVVFIWRMGHVSIHPVKAVQNAGFPSVFYIADYWLMHYMLKFSAERNRLKKIYRGVMSGGNGFSRLDFSRMIGISAAMKKSYDACGFRGEAFTVISPGIPAGDIKDNSNTPEKMNGNKKFLFTGRLVRDKGVHVAVEAFSLLVNKFGIGNASLDIIGSGPEDYTHLLKNAIEKSGLTGCVRMLGPRKHGELCESFQNYDALVFPSTWQEPFGIVIIESMSKGVPVIASRVGGVPEIINDRHDGMLVTPDNPMKLAEALRDFMTDPGLSRTLASSCTETVRKRFTREDSMKSIEEYMLAVMKHQHRKAGSVITEEQYSS